MPIIIIEATKTPFEKIDMVIFGRPRKNYVLTIQEAPTKFTQPYTHKDKSESTVVNKLLVSFQHYDTPLRIYYDYPRAFGNILMKDLYGLFDIKLTFASFDLLGWLLLKTVRKNKTEKGKSKLGFHRNSLYKTTEYKNCDRIYQKESQVAN